MLFLDGFVGLHRTIRLQHFNITGQDIDLDYCDIEWFALETNRDHSVVFEIASKYCISYSNPLQCSCLENPRDGGAWWAAI